MDYEQIIMTIIASGGTARTCAMKAIEKAKNGKIEEARELYKKACDELEEAHNFQTKLIQQEAEGKNHEVTLLMVHAQDHLMNAMTVRDLSKEFIDLYDKFSKR